MTAFSLIPQLKFECEENCLRMFAKKRKDLSVSEKLEILKSYDALSSTGISQRSAAAKLSISQPLLNKLLKNREKFEKLSILNENHCRKRMRGGKEEDVGQALKQWFLKVREKDGCINGRIMRQKAEELAVKIGKTDFKATEGWFHRWKKRENVCFTKLKSDGEQDWLKRTWQDLLAKYSPADIFNADETGLYFRALPENTYAFKSEKAKGTETSKDRLTILVCASMAGEKKKLLVIGKSKLPRCFEGIKKLPVDYEANSNAWMTSQIFYNWLVEWDKSLSRDVLLLIDDCRAHAVKDLNLKRIKIVFLPANTPSIIQPCDQGIIRTMKALYRTEMRKTVIQANEIAKKINVLEALHLINKAWGEVSAETIRNCFRHGGFLETELEEEEEEEASIEKPSGIDEEEFVNWMEVDNDLETDEKYTEDTICAEITSSKDEEENREDDYEDERNPPRRSPSNKEMLEALEVLRDGIHCRAEEFDLHYKYERFVMNLIESPMYKPLWIDF